MMRSDLASLLLGQGANRFMVWQPVVLPSSISVRKGGGVLTSYPPPQSVFVAEPTIIYVGHATRFYGKYERKEASQKTL